ncbi:MULTISPECIES: methyl-accepting chemotaxis protein [unclassified Pseudoalteromonas]|uniref:methyl-accepting chemotaxis protein n=1 Tax=unclassified Pseudoalteromonas TaxID=194690 RepID=UPI0016039709|nr:MULTISPECIES: methyl-accepting chemotaxis protein [unclassified Pseudoalteromonas]MBB1335411.1 HAMP domain-containing protein [Pseudoalteromonas sp. SR41-6]MBB1460932.1 HAMP domain-containing protein [Pseudoalteromonas sp. SG41-8]
MANQTRSFGDFVRNIGLTKKLVIAFLLVALIPLAIAISLALYNSATALNKQTYAQLEAVSEIKKSAIERHFADIHAQLLFLAQSPLLHTAADELSRAFKEPYTTALDSTAEQQLADYYHNDFNTKYRLKNEDKLPTSELLSTLSPTAKYWQSQYLADNPYPLGEKAKLAQASADNNYNLLHSKYHSFLLNFAQKFDFYDVFIIDNRSAEVIYSVYKEVDFATSLLDGPYANSNLALAFKQAKMINEDEITFVDYQQYLPSYNAPASFIATPIYNQGVHTSTLVFQLSIDALNVIMTERAGLGSSGETYLVGPDFLMRSDSFLDPENHSVVNSFRYPSIGKVKTLATELAQQGKKGQQVITDYSGSLVLSSYQPINVLGMQWSLLAEIDKNEAFATVSHLTTILVSTLIISIIAITLVAIWFARSLTRPVQLLVDTMRHVEQKGDFSVRTPVLSNDEIGSSASAFNCLLDALQSSISQTNTVMNKMAAGEFNHRISAPCKGELDSLKQATNNCADSLEQAMSELNHIIDEMSQGNFNSQITTPMQGQLATLKQNINGSLQSLNSTITEIVGVMSHIEHGDFKQQVTVAAQGSLAQLKNSVNNSVHSLAGAVSDISRVMSALHDGDFSQHLEQPLQGQLATLKNDINASVDNLALIIKNINDVMAAVNAGNFKQQVNCSANGQLSTLKHNINNSIMGLDTAVSEISNVMLAISKGNFEQTIDSDMNGQLNVLKDDVNSSISNLSIVIAELARVMAAMRSGDFNQQLETNMQGQLAQLQNDVNSSLTITADAIAEVTKVLSGLAQGNLNQQVQQDYQGVFATLKADVNQTIEKLTSVISSIQDSALRVSQSAAEIAESNTEISQRTEEQAANLEEASASSSNMLDEIAAIAKQANEAVKLAENAQMSATEGGELSIQTVHAIVEVNNSSKDINEIVSVIDEIAFQTNLLALNAAVEAARAGEHGRGFAVVANEVRELAGRSATSAKQIKTIISNSNQKISHGTALANSSGEKLKQIVSAVADVNHMIVSINSSSITQQQAIKEVDIVVQRLTTLIQENSAMTEETMAAAKQMADQANTMRHLLGYFSLQKAPL